MVEGRMTKGDRDDLVRLIRQRERVSKTAAEQRSAALLAEFERQVSAIYKIDDDQVWKEAHATAEAAVKAAQAQVAARCAELGIQKEFAPELAVGWYRRGENAAKDRRDELRRLAKAQVAALEKQARARIEADSLTAQTEVIANGLSSDAAKQFLENLAPVETLMPAIDVSVIEAKRLEKRTWE